MDNAKLIELKEDLKRRKDEKWYALLKGELKSRAERCLRDAMYASSFDGKEYMRGYYEALLSVLKLLEV